MRPILPAPNNRILLIKWPSMVLAPRARRTRAPILRHPRKIDQRLLVAAVDRILDLLVEAAARAFRERDVHVVRSFARTLDVLGKARLGRVALGIPLRKHLLQDTEAVVAHEHFTARMASHLEQVPAEALQIMTVERDVLARMIAVPLDELRDLRLLAAVDSLDERDAEVPIIDAPQLHAAFRIVRAHVVDALDQPASLDLHVEPGPLFDRAASARVGNVIDLP